MLNKIRKIFDRNYSRPEMMGVFIILIAVGLFIDLFTDRRLISNIFIAAIIFGLAYFLHKRSKRFASVLLFSIGSFVLFFSILSSAAFQLIVIAMLIYLGYHLLRKFSKPVKVDLELRESSDHEQKELSQLEPFIKGNLFGKNEWGADVYSLEDVNIQFIVGEYHIDLSYAFIPEAETVILIRGMIGNVVLFVPYDVELTVQTSSIFGKINILGNQESGINKTFKFQTKDYMNSRRKVKVITSVIVGDIEVRNI